MVYAEKEFGAERRDAIIAINLNSAFRTSRLALLGMKKQNGGRNVKVGSTHGLVASAGKSAQFAAKHGVVELTKAIALETASTGSRPPHNLREPRLKPLMRPAQRRFDLAFMALGLLPASHAPPQKRAASLIRLVC